MARFVSVEINPDNKVEYSEFSSGVTLCSFQFGMYTTQSNNYLSTLIFTCGFDTRSIHDIPKSFVSVRIHALKIIKVHINADSKLSLRI